MTGFSIRLILALGLAGFFCSVTAARASDPPPDLNAIQDLAPAVRSSTPFAEEKRHAAMRLAALGFGSRAGLARRGWEIAGLLDRHAARLSGIYRFRDLMLHESGFAVLPPAVAETRDAFRLGTRASPGRDRQTRVAHRRAGTDRWRAARLAGISQPVLARARGARRRAVPP